MGRLLGTCQTFELNAIVADVQLLIRAHGRFTFDAVSHGAGDAQDNQHHAEMNDETAVTALVASAPALPTRAITPSPAMRWRARKASAVS